MRRALISIITLLLASGAAAQAAWQPIPHAEDSAHTSGDRGLMCLAVRNDTGAALSASGKYTPLSINSDGQLLVAAECTVGGYAEDTVSANAETLQLMGAVRRDTAVASAPEGDRANVIVDDFGAVWVRPRAFPPPAAMTEGTGYSVDQNIKSATPKLRLFSVSISEKAATTSKVALRGTPGGAGSCTGTAYAYITVASGATANLEFGSRGLDASSGICADVTAGTVDVAVATAVE